MHVYPLEKWIFNPNFMKSDRKKFNAFQGLKETKYKQFGCHWFNACKERYFAFNR